MSGGQAPRRTPRDDPGFLIRGVTTADLKASGTHPSLSLVFLVDIFSLLSEDFHDLCTACVSECSVARSCMTKPNFGLVLSKTGFQTIYIFFPL